MFLGYIIKCHAPSALFSETDIRENKAFLLVLCANSSLTISVIDLIFHIKKLEENSKSNPNKIEVRKNKVGKAEINEIGKITTV